MFGPSLDSVVTSGSNTRAFVAFPMTKSESRCDSVHGAHTLYFLFPSSIELKYGHPVRGAFPPVILTITVDSRLFNSLIDGSAYMH